MTSRNISYKEILLLLLSVIITLSVALVIIRYFAPTLLGLPDDMVLVQSSEEIPPFYENVIRNTDLQSKEYLLKDPITRVRAKPFFPDMGGIGPNDMLGFRNRAIPNHADVIFIGDSQVYGNNAAIWQNIPHRVEQMMPSGGIVYSMATGGWGAPQYFYAFAKSLVFKPQVIVVAFYTGNDALGSFTLVKSSDLWKEFISDVDISKIDAPKSKFPPPEDEQWSVTFQDGTETVFTPKLRHSSNKNHPAVDAGYRIMARVADKIAEKSEQEGIKVAFTIIPTKEYVYSEKVARESIESPPVYENLIKDEGKRIRKFSEHLESIDYAIYIDLTEELKQRALGSETLYPSDNNGHPLELGYRVIAQKIASKIIPLVVAIPKSGFAIRTTLNGIRTPIFIKDDSFFIIAGRMEEIIDTVKGEIRTVSTEDLSGFKFGGYINPDDVKGNF